MSKFELIKSIEARKLNPRTGIPTTDPPVTIPFGAILEDVTQDRDDSKFSYLGQRYQCPEEAFRTATVTVATGTSPQARQPQPETAAPAQFAPVPLAPEQPACEAAVSWERVTSNWRDLMRLKVPGGWLVALADANTSPAFYPDPDHRWR
jgi:hypothetical protein